MKYQLKRLTRKELALIGKFGWSRKRVNKEPIQFLHPYPKEKEEKLKHHAYAMAGKRAERIARGLLDMWDINSGAILEMSFSSTNGSIRQAVPFEDIRNRYVVIRNNKITSTMELLEIRMDGKPGATGIMSYRDIYHSFYEIIVK